MSELNLKLESHPLCNPASVIQGENFRITVLTERLLRLEYSEKGEFEDRATQIVLNRDFPVPAFKVTETEEELKVFTSGLELVYNRKPFAANGLMIKVAGGRVNENTWHYGEEWTDLGGTARTLDEADGAIPLGHGVCSKNGFSVVDDSRSMAITESGWVETRPEGTVDFYFFGYGRDYEGAVKDLYRLCGKTPLLPRWSLGNWWSRYHKYTEKEYVELMERFEKERLPFSVAVIDMDWHLVDVDPKYGSGWTGYTWNKDFFPDPKRFMKWLHDRDMRITLNVHPADGVRAYEDVYPQVAEKMGIDPESGEAVHFDVTDEHFMDVYFKEVHHPLEEEGVDFWWLDWQQGTVTKIPGLDPLWMLNHYHYLDSKWKGSRAMTFSRYAGVGSHRYPVGFSGDTVITWESLDFQPYFTATASNVGYGWWSHDIGGHMHGVRDDELTARWVQLGVFSPLNRLHSTDNPFNGKEPWKYNRMTKAVMENFLRLRHELVPYLYTMNRYASHDGQPIVRPMYWAEPYNETTYTVPNEYYFGTEMVAAPITKPMDAKTCMGRSDAWLPEGNWFDFFNGRKYTGGRKISVYRSLDDIPVFVREGAIVPMQEIPEKLNDLTNPENMVVYAFPGAQHTFTLWEDAGDTSEDKEENWACTELCWVHGDKVVFEVNPTEGNVSVLPKERSWKFCFMGIADEKVQVLVNGIPTETKVSYDESINRLTVCTEKISVEDKIEVVFVSGATAAENHVHEAVYEILERAQIAYDLKNDLMQLTDSMGRAAVPTLLTMNLSADLLGALCEILLADA